MVLLDYAEFQKFAEQRKRNLRSISRATGNEHQFSDVVHEALLMAVNIQAKKGIEPDFSNTEYQELLLSYLYQHLVRYTETHVRNGVRLDHSAKGGEEGAPHPLLNMLTSDEGRDPLALLVDREAFTNTDAEADAHPSLAAAYLRLLCHFDYRMRTVAAHLLLSLSHTYRRMAHARVLAVHQCPLQLPLPDDRFIPGPWRRFKLMRAPVQLTFDFGEEPGLGLGLAT